MSLFSKKINKAKERIGERGVTFIELVVVISIFSIIAGTLLVNFSRFGRNVTIQNLAQDIALQINEVQKEAISGRTSDLIADCNRIRSDCSPRYGIYITARDVGNTPNLGSYAPGAPEHRSSSLLITSAENTTTFSITAGARVGQESIQNA